MAVTPIWSARPDGAALPRTRRRRTHAAGARHARLGGVGELHPCLHHYWSSGWTIPSLSCSQTLLS